MRVRRNRKLITAREQDSYRSANEGLRMRTSCFSSLIIWLYRLLNCQRRWRVGRVFLHIAMRLEGGQMQSTTARRVMREFHGVEIGDYSYGPCFDPAVVPPGVEIGRFVSLAPNARLITQNHPLDRLSTHPFAYESTPGDPASADFGNGKKEIGHDVWIGYNAVLTPGCKKVGNGAVIGAGAVVTRDVPEFSIVAGNPAKIVRQRFEDAECERVSKLNWWSGDAKAAHQILESPHLCTRMADAHANTQESVVKSPIATVIIPAHNEGSVIERCLRILLEHSEQNEVEVLVVANGCSDDTVERARNSSSNVRVLESSRPSKIEALNLGDQTASVFPRIYLDADVELDIHAVRDLVRVLNQRGIMAAAPRVSWDVTHSSFLVKAFYRIWRRQSYFKPGHIGSGVYAVSESGHERLAKFPKLTADDEFVRRLFAQDERAMASESTFVVSAPRNLKGLIGIKTRSRRGNLELKQKLQSTQAGGRQRNFKFFSSILIRPYLWFSAVVYGYVVCRTCLNARASLARADEVWERDLSSRQLTT